MATANSNFEKFTTVSTCNLLCPKCETKCCVHCEHIEESYYVLHECSAGDYASLSDCPIHGPLVRLFAGLDHPFKGLFDWIKLDPTAHVDAGNEIHQLLLKSYKQKLEVFFYSFYCLLCQYTRNNIFLFLATAPVEPDSIDCSRHYTLKGVYWDWSDKGFSPRHTWGWFRISCSTPTCPGNWHQLSSGTPPSLVTPARIILQHWCSTILNLFWPSHCCRLLTPKLNRHYTFLKK